MHQRFISLKEGCTQNNLLRPHTGPEVRPVKGQAFCSCPHDTNLSKQITDDATRTNITYTATRCKLGHQVPSVQLGSSFFKIKLLKFHWTVLICEYYNPKSVSEHFHSKSCVHMLWSQLYSGRWSLCVDYGASCTVADGACVWTMEPAVQWQMEPVGGLWSQLYSGVSSCTAEAEGGNSISWQEGHITPPFVLPPWHWQVYGNELQLVMTCHVHMNCSFIFQALPEMNATSIDQGFLLAVDDCKLPALQHTQEPCILTSKFHNPACLGSQLQRDFSAQEQFVPFRLVIKCTSISVRPHLNANVVYRPTSEIWDIN